MAKGIKFIIFLIIIGLSFFIFYNVTKQNTKEFTLISPLADVLSNSVSKKTTLHNTIENVLKESQGIYGIVVKNLKTGETYIGNEQRAFETASLYKLWIMAITYEQIENGKLTENDVLEQEIPILNEKFRIASDEAELKEGTIKLTTKEALEKMITISDNYASLLLTEKIRLSRVAAFLKQSGFTKSKVGTDGSIPITTASDIALFFEKLYNGELANQENTEKMIELLKQQRLNTKLPKLLPKDIAIAHKTGEFDPFTHDAGIVYTQNGNYIIVVLAESDSREKAEETIANISFVVYKYFNKQ